MKKEKYFIFGACDSNKREIGYSTYKRLKVPISKFKILDGDFNSIKLVGNICFDFDKDVYDVSGYIVFGEYEMFGRKSKESVVVFASDKVTMGVSINFHDMESMEKFMFED